MIYNGVAGPPHASPRSRGRSAARGMHRPHRAGKGAARIRRRGKTNPPRASAMHSSRSTERRSSPTPLPHATQHRCAPTPKDCPLQFAGWVDDIYTSLAQLDLLLVPSIRPRSHHASDPGSIRRRRAGHRVPLGRHSGSDGRRRHRPPREAPPGDGAKRDRPPRERSLPPAFNRPSSARKLGTTLHLERYHDQILQAIEPRANKKQIRPPIADERR